MAGNRIVVTGPKGTVLEEKGNPICEIYNIKVFNITNTKKSLHYNPFAYIKSEQDINTFVHCLINNAKEEISQLGEDFWVKAELLITAYMSYIVETANPEDRNFASLLEMINASETREEDEEFQNAIDLMFEDLENEQKERGEDESFAVLQYKKYKLAAGKNGLLIKTSIPWMLRIKILQMLLKIN